MNNRLCGSSVFQNGLIWFGAALSIAEIETGALIASSASSGEIRSLIWAILLGHIAGGILLFLSGLIGAFSRRSSMDNVKVPFGNKGGNFFAAANIIQLVGWTSVMIAQGSAAASLVMPSLPFGFFALLIGLLITVWLFAGIGNVVKLNSVTMTLLFVLTLFLCYKLFFASDVVLSMPDKAKGGFGFWSALELSAAMPISWLPLISDYTKDAERPVAATAVSAVVYSVASCWMYAVGFGVVLLTGTSSFADSLLLAGAGVTGLFVVLFSTVTTTFLDAYSAGESARSILPRLSAKGVGVIVCALGTIFAISGLMDHYSDFLYLISSVFAPMVAVQLVNRLVCRNRSLSKRITIVNLTAWLFGFAVYHLALGAGSPFAAIFPSVTEFFTGFASPFGALLPAMFISALLPLPFLLRLPK